MAANDWLCQFLADVLAVPVERPAVIETTALGAACLAGLGAGLYAVARTRSPTAWRLERRFEPRMDAARRERLLQGWRDAVGRVLTKDQAAP